MTRRIWRIGSLLSGDGSGTEAFASVCEKGFANGEIVLVVSDRAEAGGLERARTRNIPTFVVNDEEVGRSPALFINDFSKHLLSLEKIGELISQSADIIPVSITDVNERAAWIIKRFLAENFLLDILVKHRIDFLLLDGFAWELSAFFIEQVGIRFGEHCLVDVS
ncbi:MAG: formyltransferase family protein [Parcubacteria group bacterium]